MSLSRDEIIFLVEKIRKYFPDSVYSLILFGSFAHNNEHENSDVDIAIKGHPPLDSAKWQLLIEEFEESSFSRTVDIVDYNRVEASFRKIIDKTGVEIQAGSNMLNNNRK